MISQTEHRLAVITRTIIHHCRTHQQKSSHFSSPPFGLARHHPDLPRPGGQRAPAAPAAASVAAARHGPPDGEHLRMPARGVSGAQDRRPPTPPDRRVHTAPSLSPPPEVCSDLTKHSVPRQSPVRRVQAARGRSARSRQGGGVEIAGAENSEERDGHRCISGGQDLAFQRPL